MRDLAAKAAYMNKYMREWRRRNPDKAKEYSRRAHAKRASRARVEARERYRLFREVLDAAKSRPCMDCGLLFPPVCMDFDHLRDKSYGVGEMSGFNLARVREEIAKCDVVCANCHRIRTQRRRKTKAIEAVGPCPPED